LSRRPQVVYRDASGNWFVKTQYVKGKTVGFDVPKDVEEVAVPAENLRALIVMLIKDGTITRLQDNHPEIGRVYEVNRPKLVWVHRRELMEDEVPVGEYFIPAQVFSFETMAEYEYKRGLAYMENGDAVKAYQMFEESMRTAAKNFGFTKDGLAKLDRHLEKAEFSEAYEMIETASKKKKMTPALESDLDTADSAVSELKDMKSKADEYIDFMVARFQQVNLAIPAGEFSEYIPYIHEAIAAIQEINEQRNFRKLMRALENAQEGGRGIVLENVPYSNKLPSLDQTLKESKLLASGVSIYAGDEQGTKGMWISCGPWGFTIGVKYKAHIGKGKAAIFSHITRGITQEEEPPIVFVPSERGNEDAWDIARITGKHVLFLIPIIGAPIGSGLDSLYEGTVVQGQVDKVMERLPGGEPQQNRNLQVFNDEDNKKGSVSLGDIDYFSYPGMDAEAVKKAGIGQIIPFRLWSQLSKHKHPMDINQDGVINEEDFKIQLKSLPEDRQKAVVDTLAVSVLGHPLFAEPGEGAEVTELMKKQQKRVIDLIGGTDANGKTVRPATVTDVLATFFDSRDWENASYTGLRKDGRKKMYLINRVIWNIFRQRKAIPRSAQSLDGTDNVVTIPIFNSDGAAPHFYQAMIEEHYNEEGVPTEITIQDGEREGTGNLIKAIRLAGGKIRHVITTPVQVPEEEAVPGRSLYQQTVFEEGKFTGRMSLIEVHKDLHARRVRTIERLFSVLPTGEKNLARVYVTVEDAEGKAVTSYAIEPVVGEEAVTEVAEVRDKENKEKIVTPRQFKGIISIVPGEQIQAEEVYSGTIKMTVTGAEMLKGAINLMKGIDLAEAGKILDYSYPAGSRAYIEMSDDGKRVEKVSIMGPKTDAGIREFIVSFEAPEDGRLTFDSEKMTVEGYEGLRARGLIVDVGDKATLPFGSRDLVKGSRLVQIDSFIIRDGKKVFKEQEITVLNPDGTRVVTYILNNRNNEVHIIEGEQMRDRQVGLGNVHAIAGAGIEFRGKLYQMHDAVAGTLKVNTGKKEPEQIVLPSVSTRVRSVFAGSSVTYTVAADGKTVINISFYAPMNMETGEAGYKIASFDNPDGFPEGIDSFNAEAGTVSGYKTVMVLRAPARKADIVDLDKDEDGVEEGEEAEEGAVGHTDVSGKEVRFHGATVKLSKGSTLDVFHVYGTGGKFLHTVHQIVDPVRGNIFYTVEAGKLGRVFVSYEKDKVKFGQQEIWAGIVEGSNISGDRIATVELRGDLAYTQYVDDAALLERSGEDATLNGRVFVAPKNAPDKPISEVIGINIKAGEIGTGAGKVITAI
ncbi:MAG: hypothetical protein WBD12_06520, partial [Candidatus Omnitrophota bacterium]